MSSFINNFKSNIFKNFEADVKNTSQPKEAGNKATEAADPAKQQLDDSASQKKPISVQPAQLANKIFGMAVKASTKLQEKATNLTAIVNEKTIIGNIERERQKFIGELRDTKWAGYEDGTLAKLLSNPEAQKHIIAISSEPNNFTEDPPVANVVFEPIAEEIKLCANELFKLDPRIKEVRFMLVPKKISEENFWRNYAYRLSLVKKVFDEKNATATEPEKEEVVEHPKTDIPPTPERKESNGEDEQDILEKELLNDLDEDYEVVNGGKKDSNDKLDEELNKEIDALLGEDGK